MAHLRPYLFLVALLWLLVNSAPAKVPVQFVYTASNANTHETDEATSCEMTRWMGTDASGMAGYPHATKIACPDGGYFVASGVVRDGAFQVWLVEGELEFNQEKVTVMGSSFWANDGAFVNISIVGKVWIIGGKFQLEENGRADVFTSSYDAPQVRKYDMWDAKRGVGNASLGHDHHILNGSSPSVDFVFGSQSFVDPPVVTVLNCANGSTPETNYVWSHFHPFGAVYIPMSGAVCFSTDSTTCAIPGEARWTSPLLQYYEWFKKPAIPNAFANFVRDLADVKADVCDRPIVFAVTNFDAAAKQAGVPNFRDWPRNAHGSKSSAGIGSWGVFETMTVRSTTVVTKTVKAITMANSLVV